MSSNLQYDVDYNQTILLAHCACSPWFFINSGLSCRCIFAIAILTESNDKNGICNTEAIIIPFQYVFQVCMHLIETLRDFPSFCFSQFLILAFFHLPFFISGRFPPKYQGKQTILQNKRCLWQERSSVSSFL